MTVIVSRLIAAVNYADKIVATHYLVNAQRYRLNNNRAVHAARQFFLNVVNKKRSDSLNFTRLSSPAIRVSRDSSIRSSVFKFSALAACKTQPFMKTTT